MKYRWRFHLIKVTSCISFKGYMLVAMLGALMTRKNWFWNTQVQQSGLGYWVRNGSRLTVSITKNVQSRRLSGHDCMNYDEKPNVVNQQWHGMKLRPKQHVKCVACDGARTRWRKGSPSVWPLCCRMLVGGPCLYAHESNCISCVISPWERLMVSKGGMCGRRASKRWKLGKSQQTEPEKQLLQTKQCCVFFLFFFNPPDSALLLLHFPESFLCLLACGHILWRMFRSPRALPGLPCANWLSSFALCAWFRSAICGPWRHQVKVGLEVTVRSAVECTVRSPLWGKIQITPKIYQISKCHIFVIWK